MNKQLLKIFLLTGFVAIAGCQKEEQAAAPEQAAMEEKAAPAETTSAWKWWASSTGQDPTARLLWMGPTPPQAKTILTSLSKQRSPEGSWKPGSPAELLSSTP